MPKIVMIAITFMTAILLAMLCFGTISFDEYENQQELVEDNDSSDCFDSMLPLCIEDEDILKKYEIIAKIRVKAMKTPWQEGPQEP